ncbi:hypothetical protein B0H11DRAFT_1908461 [Mycena galericulata]|nr:hypothetical protein B0H11DRAFT_1908461 [Mycena galericulata]
MTNNRKWNLENVLGSMGRNGSRTVGFRFSNEIGFVTPTLQRHLVTYLETEPVAVFALGCQYGWKDIAEKAAKETLKRPLTSLFRPDLARYLKHVSADNYRALLVYHDACGMAVSSAGHLLPWRRPTWIWLQCRMCDPSMHKHTMPVTPRAWIFDYLDRTSALLKKIPGSNLSDIVLLNPTLKTAVACLACRPYAFTHLMEFVLEEYIPAVDAALNVVSLRLSF